MSDPILRLNAALEGRYRILREVGHGGMATVYLAEDVRHERNVALKVLKPELAAAVGEKRFLSEIKTTANLSHPNVLPLFDSGQADGFLFYVMPYVEGESLRARLEREGQLPVDDAVRIATGVLDALDHAHRNGVVHRDIKPGNILLQDGRPLVADFGIALAVGAREDRLTDTGLSLGTPEYMSPEQATGSQTIGAATDIWAAGCVLYEMLVGEPPHTAKTPQVVLGRIVSSEAEPVTARRKTAPSNVSAAVAKSLEKIPADRFVSAAEFARALSDPDFARDPIVKAGGGRSWSLAAGAFALGAVAWAVVGGLTGATRGSAVGDPVVRFKIDGDFIFPTGRIVAVAPAGDLIADATREAVLSVRGLDRTDAPDTLASGFTQPFFSPSGEWIGGFPGNGIGRVSRDGGVPEVLVRTNARFFGGSWLDEETLVVASSLGLHRVSVVERELELLAEPDTTAGELYYAWPEALPGGRAVLFTIVPTAADSDAEAEIAVMDLESGVHTTVLRGGSSPRYAPGGRLIYSARGQLHAVGFDPESYRITGDPVPLPIDGVRLARPFGADFDVSDNGTLSYVPEPGPLDRTMVWISPDGSEEPLGTPPLRYVYPRISPDGTRIVVDVSGDSRDLYIWNVERRTLSRLTDHPGEEFFGLWSPDGRRVYFTSNRTGVFNVHVRNADGSGEAEIVHADAAAHMLSSRSSDGRHLIVARVGEGEAGFDLISVDLLNPSMRSHLATPAAESSADLSPDGRWLAYQSDASGQLEVYVGPFPNTGDRRWKISINGGSQPRWDPAGDRLYYRAPTGEILGVSVGREPDFSVGEVSRVLPHVDGWGSSQRGGRRYDISPVDGRFLVTKPVEGGESNGLVVVVNWIRELDQLVPPA